MKKLAIFFLASWLLAPEYKVLAQEVISSAGAQASNAFVQLSWTVGEPVIETFLSPSIVLTQGFQQSRLTVTSIAPSTLRGIEMLVFPNPTSSQIILYISRGFRTGLHLTLLNSEGRILFSKAVKRAKEVFNLDSYAPGVYYLRIQNPGKPGSLSFSILKQ